MSAQKFSASARNSPVGVEHAGEADPDARLLRPSKAGLLSDEQHGEGAGSIPAANSSRRITTGAEAPAARRRKGHMVASADDFATEFVEAITRSFDPGFLPLDATLAL